MYYPYIYIFKINKKIQSLNILYFIRVSVRSTISELKADVLSDYFLTDITVLRKSCTVEEIEESIVSISLGLFYFIPLHIFGL